MCNWVLSKRRRDCLCWIGGPRRCPSLNYKVRNGTKKTSQNGLCDVARVTPLCPSRIVDYVSIWNIVRWSDMREGKEGWLSYNWRLVWCSCSTGHTKNTYRIRYEYNYRSGRGPCEDWLDRNTRTGRSFESMSGGGPLHLWLSYRKSNKHCVKG
jgi:hypothetical protein